MTQKIPEIALNINFEVNSCLLKGVKRSVVNLKAVMDKCFCFDPEQDCRLFEPLSKFNHETSCTLAVPKISFQMIPKSKYCILNRIIQSKMIPVQVQKFLTRTGIGIVCKNIGPIKSFKNFNQSNLLHGNGRQSEISSLIQCYEIWIHIVKRDLYVF